MRLLALTLALLALPTRAQEQQDYAWRLDLGKHCVARFAGPSMSRGTAVDVEFDGRGTAHLNRASSRITFAPDRGFGVTSEESFTLELDLRCTVGEFSTVLMCREGSAVHYSILVGRAPGRVAFEAWTWNRERALSRRRLDDGKWHRIAAAYDARTRSMALLVDGALDAVVKVTRAFGGSRQPGLRLGDNLDPNVRQPFLGDLRNLRMKRGIPALFEAHLAHERALRVLEPGTVDAALEAWLVNARRARPPIASDRAAWEAQAAKIRAGVQDALGLWPPPYGGQKRLGRRADVATDFATFRPSLPLSPVRGGSLERDGWSVTRIYWRSFENYFASGWLYEPSGAESRADLPAILCPHGHWQHGARHPVVQARCIMLARLGYVALAVDSVHHYEARYGLTPVSVMTWNNLRAIELLRSLEHVDAKRIGCTGASGGGQQTYYLTALRTDLAAAAPAVMACHFDEILLSSGVHCACNFVTHLMPVADMPQMAATFAPRPQLFLSVTGDWTRRFPERGLPEIRAIYRLYGAQHAVEGHRWESKHDYNRDQRNTMYAFFERNLRGIESPRSDLEPASLATEARETLDALDAVVERSRVPQDLGSVTREFRERLRAPRVASSTTPDTSRSRLSGLYGHAAPEPVSVRRVKRFEIENLKCESFVVRTPDGVDLPLLLFVPPAELRGAKTAVLVSERGKAQAFVHERARIDRYLASGVPVLLVDVRYVGELDAAATWRDPYGRFLGEDEGLLAVRDLRCILEAITAIDEVPERVEIVGLGSAGATALVAAALSQPDRVVSLVCPELGPLYRESDRRPFVSRVLLHCDLDDALRAFEPRPIRRE